MTSIGPTAARQLHSWILVSQSAGVAAGAGRSFTSAVHRDRHSRRGPAAHHRRHAFQHPAGQRRRPARCAAPARGAACGVRHRILPRRRDAPRGAGRAGGGGAGEPVHPQLRGVRQQGDQDRRPDEVAAQRGAGAGQDPESIHARGRAPVPHRAVLLPWALQRAHRRRRRGNQRQPGGRARGHRRGKARQDPPDQRGRQQALR